jgi:tetratricopeptide (TPR) repeat protein
MISDFFRDLDTVDVLHLARIALYFGCPCFTMLSLLWVGLAVKQVIPVWLLVVLLGLNLPLTGAGVIVVYQTTSKVARSLANALTAGGNIPPPPSYPQQEILIAQGRYKQAAEAFQDHITITPDDHEARLRLADLLERHLNDVGGAERLYLEVRRSKPTPNQEMTATNGLIDLYRKAGRRDRLKVELARFADRYRGTRLATGAARELRELKAEDGG